MGTGTSGDESGALPDVPAQVRTSLVALAADTLGSLDAALVPTALQRVRGFAPRRRASSGAVPLWRALVEDDGFRHAVAAAWSRGSRTGPDGPRAATGGDHETATGGDGETGPGDATGTVPGDDRATAPGSGPDTAPDDARVTKSAGDDGPAALRAAAVEAFLLRPEGWERAVERARAAERDASSARRERGEVERLRAERDRLGQQVAEVRTRLADETARADAADAELAAARRGERRARADADRARAEARAAVEQARADREAARAAHDAAAEARRAAAADLARARAERDAARHEVAAGTDLATARARLLLDTVVDAAAGLRRELALGPSTTTPADEVAARLARSEPAARPGSRGRSGDDPARLDDLLSVPRTHLVVDGYNVTKAGYGELTLAEQRDRLVAGLLRVAAATGTEVTCCFDGTEAGVRPAAAPRGVRVLFSVGEIADDLIRRLVAAEPPGRPVVVVTSDRAVADDVQAMGAVSVPSATLLARLARR